jgi:formamidopyrimidine-DNA glycosylase
MPELPDVEATRRYLVSRGLVGSTIVGAELLWPRAVRMPSSEEFQSDVADRLIDGVRRRAKYLILDLHGATPNLLVLHLGMTGALLVQGAAEARPRYAHNVFTLDGGVELRFVDPRKLGKMWLAGDESEVLAGLGPEPLEPGFTPDILGARLLGRDAPVKALLCDQAVLAGIGNIYADEVLFIAGIHPLKRGRDLSPGELDLLHQAITRRLAEATETLVPLAGGDRPPTEGALHLLEMPRTEGEACSRCGTPVGREVVRDRSSYYCPKCQVM